MAKGHAKEQKGNDIERGDKMEMALAFRNACEAYGSSHIGLGGMRNSIMGVLLVLKQVRFASPMSQRACRAE